MARVPLDLAKARILVTNDDGIHAPGLKTLERIAKAVSKDVWVVAPETEQSATSHSLTLRRPLHSRKLGSRRFTVDGTPTDCVLVAQHKILAERPADLVLSGVNHGANLGEDVHYSGTVAAAMEAAMLGAHAIAFSQLRLPDRSIKWATAEAYGPAVIRGLAGMAWPKDLLINVNFPACAADDVTGIQVCSQGRRDQGIDIVEGKNPFGRPFLWIGNFSSDKSAQANSDLRATEEGAVSITPLHLDLTHRATLKSLREVFA